MHTSFSSKRLSPFSLTFFPGVWLLRKRRKRIRFTRPSVLITKPLDERRGWGWGGNPLTQPNHWRAWNLVDWIFHLQIANFIRWDEIGLTQIFFWSIALLSSLIDTYPSVCVTAGVWFFNFVVFFIYFEDSSAFNFLWPPSSLLIKISNSICTYT